MPLNTPFQTICKVIAILQSVKKWMGEITRLRLIGKHVGRIVALYRGRIWLNGSPRYVRMGMHWISIRRQRRSLRHIRNRSSIPSHRRNVSTASIRARVTDLTSVTEISVYEFRSTTCGQTTRIYKQRCWQLSGWKRYGFIRYTCNSHDLFSFSGGETPTKPLFFASPESSLIRFC